MYRSAGDTLGFATNGVERVTIGNSVVAFAVAVSIPYNASGRLGLWDSDSSHQMFIVPGSNLTADRVLTITTGDAARTLTMTADASVGGTNSGDVTLAGAYDYITIAGQVITRGQIDLTTDVTGALPVGNGGTGLASGTSGGITYFSAANTMASTAALGNGQIVLGGGAGAAPTSSSALVFAGGLALNITAAQPSIGLIESDVAADDQIWSQVVNGGVYSIKVFSGDLLSSATAISVTRSGVTVTALGLSATTVAVTGDFTVSGGATLGDAAGDSHTINGNITQSSDTDRTNIFGRVRIDSRGADQAYFSHYDMSSTAQYAMRQNASGYTRINAATGQGIDLRINDTNVAVFNATNLTLSLPVSQSADTDVTNVLGRVRLDSRVADSAFFSHYDMTTSAQSAISQDANGATTVNSASTQLLVFAIGGVASMAMTAVGAVALGAGGSARGALSLAHGAGGNTAGYVAMNSRNGTTWYLWFEDDGTVKRSNAAPVNNADGSEVGTQT
jgi:hypothetical protein